MKKLMYLLSIVLISSLVLTGCSLLSNISQVPATDQSGITYLTKHAENAPFESILFAGQNIDVGTVSVWNDEENLYITYDTTGGWEMTETHLAVAGSLPGIPQTKKGNPIPGKFPYQCCYDEDEGEWVFQIKEGGASGATCDEDGNTNTTLTEVEYIIPLSGIGVGGVGADDILYIAAHAKVIRSIEDCWETVWQIGDVEEIVVASGDPGWTGLSNYADEFNWGDPAGPTTMGPSLVVEKPDFTNPFIVGTTLTDKFPYNSNDSILYNYATDFDVQWNGSLAFGGLLTISWSPGSSSSEKKVVSEGGIIPTTFTAVGASKPGEGWFMDKYPLVEHSVAVSPLPSGDHIINFQHTQGDGTFWDWIKLEKPCVQEESAWAAGKDFPGANWATYFEYDVQSWKLLDTIEVPAIGTKMESSVLKKDQLYKFEASGTCNWRVPPSPSGYQGDAEYWLRNDGGGVGWIHMGIWSLAMWNGALVEVEWGTYNDAHVYTFEYIPSADGIVTFFFNDDAYGDNSGHLTVTIYEWKFL